MDTSLTPLCMISIKSPTIKTELHNEMHPLRVELFMMSPFWGLHHNSDHFSISILYILILSILSIWKDTLSTNFLYPLFIISFVNPNT